MSVFAELSLPERVRFCWAWTRTFHVAYSSPRPRVFAIDAEPAPKIACSIDFPLVATLMLRLETMDNVCRVLWLHPARAPGRPLLVDATGRLFGYLLIDHPSPN